MRPKPKKPLVAAIPEIRILQLSNDLSENVRSGTTEEWRAVALYFRNEVDRREHSLGSIRPSISAFLMAEKIRSLATRELQDWLDRMTPKDP